MDRCEWNPLYDVPAMDPRKQGDCANEATFSVGVREPYHLCESCAERAAFRRMKRRPIAKLETQSCKA